MRPGWRQRVQFERANLTAQFPADPGRCQVVFCRNVLIYLSRSAAESFLDRLADWLAPGGLVFLGYSEAVLAPTPRLRVQRLGATHALQVVRAAVEDRPRGLWTTPSPDPGDGLRSPTGGPSNGPSGSRAPGPATAAEMTASGEVAARRGDHASAVVAFRKAVFLDPDQPVVWFQLGVALGAVRDRRGARRAYSAALAALERCDRVAVGAGLDGWAADELAGVLRDRLGRP